MKLSSLNKEPGITLTELLIVLALLGVVLAVGYNFFIFGLRSYNRGEQQSIAQHSTRLASGFITSELRYASSLEIIGSPGGGAYRYIYENNGSIIFLNEEGSTRVLADGAADGFDYSILFIAEDTSAGVIPDDYADLIPPGISGDLIFYIIDADDGLYRLSSTVQALNLGLYENAITVGEGASTVVRYQKPAQ